MNRKFNKVLCIIFFAALLFIPQYKAEAAARLDTLSFSSYSWSRGSYSKTYTQYDFTGDGVKDNVVITASRPSGGGGINSLSVKVNGKKAWSWSGHDFNEGLTLKLCTLSNGKVYFFVKGEIENLDSVLCVFLRYINGSFKVICDCVNKFAGGAYCIGEPVSVSGNTITYEANINTPAMGDMNVKYQFRWSGGALKLKSKTGEIVRRWGRNKGPDTYFTLAKKVSLYKTTTAKKATLTFAAGTKVRITHIYLNGKNTVRFKLTAQNGKSGWVNGKTYATKRASWGATVKCPIIKEFIYVA